MSKKRVQGANNATLWSRPSFLARRFHQINVAIFLETCSGANLTPIQWGVMTVVADEPGLGYSDIALLAGIDRHNATDVALRLQEKGIFRISFSETDKRKACIYITRNGRNIIKRFESRINQSQRMALEPLDLNEREIFLDLLKRIIEHNNSLSRAPILRGGGKQND